MKTKYFIHFLLTIIVIFSIGGVYQAVIMQNSPRSPITNDIVMTTTAWTNATVISDDDTLWNDASSRFSDVAVDNNGFIHVVWSDYTNGTWGTNDWEIFYAFYSETTGWTNITVISDGYGGSYWNDESSGSPRIAVDGMGNLHVVWYDLTDGEWGADSEIMYVKYTVGVGWSNITVISDDITLWNDLASTHPAIAVDNVGTVHVVWQDSTAGVWGGGASDTEIMYTNNFGGSWANATVVSDGVGGLYWNDRHSQYPSIAVSSTGVIHVVWMDQTDGWWGDDDEIMYASYTAGPGWTNATVISDDISDWNNYTSTYPCITVDDLDLVHIVWQDDTDGWWGTDIEVMYKSKTPMSGWSYHQIISDDHSEWNTGDSERPRLAADALGVIHVVWQDSTAIPWGADNDIMYSFKNPFTGQWNRITVISDAPSGWNDGASENPAVVIDRTRNNLHVIWDDDTSGSWGSDIEIMYSMNALPTQEDLTGERPDWLLPLITLVVVAILGCAMALLQRSQQK